MSSFGTRCDDSKMKVVSSRLATEQSTTFQHCPIFKKYFLKKKFSIPANHLYMSQLLMITAFLKREEALDQLFKKMHSISKDCEMSAETGILVSLCCRSKHIIIAILMEKLGWKIKRYSNLQKNCS